MRNYKESEFSIKFMIWLRDKKSLKECLEMRSAFKAQPNLLRKDTMNIVITELSISIKNKQINK